MSAWPLLTAVKRVCTVTGTHLTCSGVTPTWRSMTPMTLRHSSPCSRTASSRHLEGERQGVVR